MSDALQSYFFNLALDGHVKLTIVNDNARQVVRKSCFTAPSRAKSDNLLNRRYGHDSFSEPQRGAPSRKKLERRFSALSERESNKNIPSAYSRWQDPKRSNSDSALIKVERKKSPKICRRKTALVLPIHKEEGEQDLHHSGTSFSSSSDQTSQRSSFDELIHQSPQFNSMKSCEDDESPTSSLSSSPHVKLHNASCFEPSTRWRSSAGTTPPPPRKPWKKDPTSRDGNAMDDPQKQNQRTKPAADGGAAAFLSTTPEERSDGERALVLIVEEASSPSPNTTTMTENYTEGLPHSATPVSLLCPPPSPLSPSPPPSPPSSPGEELQANHPITPPPPPSSPFKITPASSPRRVEDLVQASSSSSSSSSSS